MRVRQQRRAAAIYLTGSKPAVITLPVFMVFIAFPTVDPSVMSEVLIMKKNLRAELCN